MARTDRSAATMARMLEEVGGSQGSDEEFTKPSGGGRDGRNPRKARGGATATDTFRESDDSDDEQRAIDAFGSRPPVVPPVGTGGGDAASAGERGSPGSEPPLDCSALRAYLMRPTPASTGVTEVRCAS